MAFSSIVDDMRRMNANMIAMGQSIDIQKMPRPKTHMKMDDFGVKKSVIL